MATIEEVAKLAGVSVATVSRVLNKNYTVSDKRIKMVMDAVEKLDYKTNLVGRMLRTSESRTILVAFSVLIPEFMDAVLETANEYGYDIIFSYCLPHLTNTKPLKPLYNGLVDGVILQNVMLDEETFADVCNKFPVVFCGDIKEYSNTLYNRISIDNESISYKMTEHLINKGRNRIAFVGVNDEHGFMTKFSKEREKGVLKAIDDYGKLFESKMKCYVISGYQGGREAADYFMSIDTLPDAIFCFTDNIAIGCIRRLKELGIRIPQDVAVAGFDNIGITEQYIPTITTVSQPFYEMGVESIRKLIKGEEYHDKSLQIISGKLVLRESTGD